MSSRREWGSDVWKCAWETRTKRNGRLDMSAEECDVCEVMWNTAGPQNNLQEGSRHMTRKHRGRVSGQKARLCWQQRFESTHNSRSSNPLGSVFFAPWLLVLKDGGPPSKSHADAPARSIDNHCWRSEYWGAAFWAVKTWWKLPPGSSAAFKSNPHLHISHRSRTSAVYLFNPGRGWGGGGRCAPRPQPILRDADELRVKEGPSSSCMLSKQHGFLNGSKLMFEQVKWISVNLQK